MRWNWIKDLFGRKKVFHERFITLVNLNGNSNIAFKQINKQTHYLHINRKVSVHLNNTGEEKDVGRSG